MFHLVSEKTSNPVKVHLRYDAGDPYAVSLTFHRPGSAPLTWTFGRELLIGGMFRPHGEGDVRVAPANAGTFGVLILLRSGTRRALFLSDIVPLVDFLSRTEALVPLGRESSRAEFAMDLDAVLDRILTE